MLKLGVLKPEQFFPAPPKAWLDYFYYRLSRSRVSLCLLDNAAHSTTSVLFEQLMPHVRLANGVFRTTFRQRFRNLDPLVNPILAENFSSSADLTVEDWAASACLTSAEWAGSLHPLFPRMRFAASDLVLFLVAVKDARSNEIVVAEPDGQPLQYIHAPFVIRMAPPEPWSLAVNRLAYMRAASYWEKLRPFWPLPDDWLDAKQWDTAYERDGYRFSKLPLIHPEALALVRQQPWFSIRRHSVFEAAKSPVHVIRSMNILNKNYFTDQQLKEGIRSALGSLEEGGIWIVGRTIAEDPPAHDATIFRKTLSGRLEAIGRVGAGSEIESVVQDASPGS